MIEIKDKHKKKNYRRRYIRDLRARQMREEEAKGVSEYRKYIKEVEERLSEQRRKEKILSEQEYENYRRQ